MRRLYNIAALLCAGLIAMLAAASPAAANGYWNLPSTCCQCWGVGFGAGYHANYVLGPMTCQEMFDHKEVRLPYAPSPPCGYHCSGYGQAHYHPSQLEGSVTAPTAVPPLPLTSAPNESLPPPTEFDPAPIDLPTAPSETPTPQPAQKTTQPIFGAPVEP